MKEPIPTPPYVHQHYPKFLYHPTERPRCVATAEEHDELSDAWYETPGEAADHRARDEQDALAIQREAEAQAARDAEERQRISEQVAKQARDDEDARVKKAVAEVLAEAAAKGKGKKDKAEDDK